MLPKDLINPAVAGLSSLALLTSSLLQEREKTAFSSFTIHS